MKVVVDPRRVVAEIIEQAAAGGVDDDGALRHPPERLGVQDALGLGRQRQQADDDLRAGEEVPIALLAVEGRHAGEVLVAAGPAGDVEVERLQFLRRVGADDAEAHDADPAPLRDHLRQRLPPRFTGVAAVVAEAAVEVQHPIKHVLAHADGERRIHQAHDRHVVRQVALHQVVDAGAEVRVEGDWLNVPRMVASRDEILRLFQNLIDNALKYGAGRMTLYLAVEGDDVIVGLADQGAGIAPEREAEALRRFGRLDPARGIAGAGLGLSLIAAVARMHGGDVRFDRRDEQFAVEMLLRRPA